MIAPPPRTGHNPEARTMSLRSLIVAALLAAAPLGAHAGDLSYSTIELGWQRSSPDILESGDGFGVRGTARLTDNWHVYAGYGRTDNEIADLSDTRVGVGYNLAIADDWDLIARVGYEAADFDTLGDADGYGVEIGVRGAIDPAFEVAAGVRHRDLDVEGDVVCPAIFPTPAPCAFVIDQDGTSTAFYVGGQWKITDTVGIVADASFGNKGKQYFVGPRLSF